MRATKIGLYSRISVDKSGKREGVDAQEAWGREYASTRWPGATVRAFTDNNLSAARDNRRPGYEDLRAAVRAGEITHVWVVEQSRLERRKVEWFSLVAELIAAGITELHTRREGVVRLDEIGSDVQAIINAKYIAELRRKTCDKHEVIAAAGRPNGGDPFGYRHGVDMQGRKSLIVHEEEAAAVRWAADAVLSGWSLAHVAEKLTADGLTGRRGGALTASALRTILTAPVTAGKRTFRGTLTAGIWEPLLTPALWEQVRARLDGPRSVTRRDGNGAYAIGPAALSHTPARRYLLTGGLAVCGACGTAMQGGLHRRAARGRTPKTSVPALMCPPVARGGHGCVTILATPTEEYVADELFRELDRPEFLAALVADDGGERRDELLAELAGVESRRAELATLWAAGDATTTEWAAARQSLDAREKTLRADLAAVPAPPVRLDGIAGARQAWPAMTLAEKRELLRMFIEKVVINRAAPGTRAFDPGRVEIVWKLA